MRWSMTRVFIVVACIAAAALLGLRYAIPEGQVVLDPEGASFERTSESQSEPLEAQVTVRNPGWSAVTILDVKPSCTCTVVDPPTSSVIPPGGAVSLSIKATPPQFGEEFATVVIRTNSKKTPIVTWVLTLRGLEQKAPRIESGPQSWTLTGTRRGDPIEGEVGVVTIEEQAQPPWIEAIEYGDPTMIAALPETRDEPVGGGLALRYYTFRVAPLTPAEGVSASKVLAVIRGEQNPEPLEIGRLRVEFRPPVRVVPDRLQVDAASGALLTDAIQLFAEDGEPFEVQSVVFSRPGMMSIEPASTAGDTTLHEIRISLPRDSTLLLRADDRLVVTTTHLEAPRIEVPVEFAGATEDGVVRPPGP